MTYTVGQSAKDVFKETIPKIIGTLGQEPPFIIVTTLLTTKYLITDEELEHIETKPTPAKKGKEITQKLQKKIKDSDDPVQCLLTICDVFESEEVNNEILRKHGASMRSNFTSKNNVVIFALSTHQDPLLLKSDPTRSYHRCRSMFMTLHLYHTIYSSKFLVIIFASYQMKTKYFGQLYQQTNQNFL